MEPYIISTELITGTNLFNVNCTTDWLAGQTVQEIICNAVGLAVASAGPYANNLAPDYKVTVLLKVKVVEHYWNGFVCKKGARQGCVLSPYLFNILAEMVMRESLDGFQGGLQVGGRMITNLRYADDIILLATSEPELQELVDHLDRVSCRNKWRKFLYKEHFVHFTVLRWIRCDSDLQRFAVTTSCTNNNELVLMFSSTVLFTQKTLLFEYFKARKMLQCKIVIKRVSFEATVLFITWLTATSTKAKWFSVLASWLTNWWSVNFHI